jgi:hypothetical protein
MGLLVWDDGQTAHRPLIGAAILASARYTRRLRDKYLAWGRQYPCNSEHFDERAKIVRQAGLSE